ncbi:MAG: HEAT repeat domain-containing protein [Kiritimatiellia bacterium]
MKTDKKKTVLFVIFVGVGLLFAVYYTISRKSSTGSEESQDYALKPVSGEGLSGEKNGIKQFEESKPAEIKESDSDEAGDGKQLSSEEEAAAKVVADKKDALSPEEKLVADMDTLIDVESYNEAIKLARELMKSKDPKIRLAAAENLGWIGIEALPELSLMISDANQEVAESAFNYWLQAVDNLEDDKQKAGLLVEGLKNVDDELSVEEGVMLINSMPEDVGVRALVSIIEEGNSVASVVAREHYYFCTDQEYISRANAENWLRQQAE